MERINDNLIDNHWQVFTLTYGSMVQQLLKDYEEVNEVNAQLDKM